MGMTKATRARKRYYDEVSETLGRGVDEASIEINRQGARRPRIKVHRSLEPILTDRQRNVLKGKAKVARSWGRMLALMNETGMTAAEFVANLSDEEIVRGQIKAKDGSFKGHPPQWVPREFHRACIAELMKRGKRLWTENYLNAIQVMSDIAAGRGDVGRRATPSERIKAATMVIEKLEGKVPERIALEDEQPWEGVIEGIVAEVSEEQVGRARRALGVAHQVVEGTFTVNGEEEGGFTPDDAPPPEPVRRSPRRPRRVVR